MSTISNILNDWLLQAINYGLTQTEIGRRWLLLQSKTAEAIRRIPSNSTVSNISQIHHLLYGLSQFTSSPLPPFTMSPNWGERFLEPMLYLKFSMIGIKNVPREARLAYGHTMQVLELISPETAKFIRSYKPQKAFRVIAAELLANPISLIHASLETNNRIGTTILNIKDEYAGEHGTLLNRDEWLIIMKAGTLMDQRSIDLHDKAVPRIVKECFRPELSETDEAFCDRLINAIRRVYGIKTPYSVNFVTSDDRTAASASMSYDNGKTGNPKTHRLTLTNFDILDDVQKFVLIMHECAAHMFRHELENNEDYTIPVLDGSYFLAETNGTIGNNLPPIITDGKVPIPADCIVGNGNADRAKQVFGDEIGRKMYILDVVEREAQLVEALTLRKMFSDPAIYAALGESLKDTVFTSLLKRPVDIPDRYPAHIATNVDYNSSAEMLRMPSQWLESRTIKRLES